MGVGIQREGGVGVAQDAGQGFGVHTAGEGMGCEGMPKSWNSILNSYYSFSSIDEIKLLNSAF